jgi:hypothetical protein
MLLNQQRIIQKKHNIDTKILHTLFNPKKAFIHILEEKEKNSLENKLIRSLCTLYTIIDFFNSWKELAKP